MANYTKEIAHMLERLHTKILSQDKGGYFKRDIGFKLSLLEMLMLKRIGEHGRVRLNDLITELEIDRNLVTTTVKRLMTLKLVLKKQDESDGRGQCVELSPAGEVLYHKILKLQEKELGFVLSDVTINEEKAILKFISKIVQYHTDKFEIK